MPRKQGFTLIEMLLVVSIIVLLVSLLLPALNKGFDATKTASCKTNQRAIYAATYDYAAAHHKKLPAARQWVTHGLTGWFNINAVRDGTLYDYMGQNENAYLCPKFLDVYRKWNPSNHNKTAAFSYSLNEYMGNSWQGQPGIRIIDGAQHPDELCMYTDENAWTVHEYASTGINNGAMGVGRYNSPGHLVDALGSFHDAPNGNLNDGFSNVLFVDGHIELVHISQTKEVCTPKRYKQ